MGVIIIIKQVVKIGGSLFPDYAIELAEKLKNTENRNKLYQTKKKCLSEIYKQEK